MKRCCLFLVLAAYGCSSTPDQTDTAPIPPGRNGLSPVTGTPAGEIDEAFGIFVAPKGRDTNAGTRAAPLATLSAGIAAAKIAKKRVYACEGAYAEAIALADGVDVVGGFDCTTTVWTPGKHRSKVVAPTSPAMVAKGITSRTLVEGFEIFAPDGDPSSIALLADEAHDLTFADVRLVAGNGRAGANGSAPVQLVYAPVAGTLGIAPEKARCDALCAAIGEFLPYGGGRGGRATCEGENGHDPEAGGAGGSGGVLRYDAVSRAWVPIDANPMHAMQAGETKTGASGAPGAEGASAESRIFLTREGYATADGAAGTSGLPGMGGKGGDSQPPPTTPLPAAYQLNDYWVGHGGNGGGAGGCPGLAGSAGTGGGASIGALLFFSSVSFVRSEVVSSEGGAGGAGSIGSNATPGQATETVIGGVYGGRPGGAGGRAGISGSGAGGPSIAVAYTGTAPQFDEATVLTPGRGGAGVPAATASDPNGTRTLPASGSGESKAKHLFRAAP